MIAFGNWKQSNMVQETAKNGLDIIGMLEDWRFWVAMIGYLVVHVSHNARLQQRSSVSENRLKRIEDKVFK